MADSTDLYAFVSPDRPHTVTILANYIPLEAPDGGPNFYEFGDNVRYEIHVSNRGDAQADITYRFEFTTEVRNSDTFLYNTGRISSLNDPNFNRRQFFDVTAVARDGSQTVLARHLPCPPCNIGFRSTPDYAHLADEAMHELSGGLRVFAGQRSEGFYVDLGAVFDLADLRPFSHLHLYPSKDAPGVNSLAHVNVHTIAVQVAIRELTRGHRQPTDPSDPHAVIGIWTSASRQQAQISEANGTTTGHGPYLQISRLGNPLINEAVIAMGDKDRWNRRPPSSDRQFLEYYEHPEVSKLLPVLYPGVFPHLAALTADRADVVAILLTGIPSGVVPGFMNFTGSTYADLLRLNVAFPPAQHPNRLGLLGGDVAGFPNGRRPLDDVFTIELRVLAGVTYPLIDPHFTPDAAASVVTDGSPAPSFLAQFPYLNTPHAGFSVKT